jgi:hypothetical protein
MMSQIFVFSHSYFLSIFHDSLLFGLIPPFCLPFLILCFQLAPVSLPSF